MSNSLLGRYTAAPDRLIRKTYMENATQAKYASACLVEGGGTPYTNMPLTTESGKVLGLGGRWTPKMGDAGQGQIWDWKMKCCQSHCNPGSVQRCATTGVILQWGPERGKSTQEELKLRGTASCTEEISAGMPCCVCVRSCVRAC